MRSGTLQEYQLRSIHVKRGACCFRRRRQEYLDAFEKCVARYGIEGATLAKIAEIAGLARPLVRHNVGNRDTYLRIHGSPWPRSIGGRASSGCVRMIMPHINALYEEVALGSTAHLYEP